MLCPHCQHAESKVLETRETSDKETRRRRECLKCEKRFTTYERIEYQPLFVIKKDGKRESFDKQKIVRGLMRSCEKRPVSLFDIEKLVDDVEYKLRNTDEQEIKSSKIGKLVMNRLKKIDKIAYIRFASVYRDFTDIESFQGEIEKLASAAVDKNVKEKLG
jgi:transcriptional repressor NrdR